MASKLIELEDGILIEVEVPDGEAKQISNRAADAVSTTFDKIKPILKKTMRPIVEIWDELDQDVELEAAEVEVNFSFEGEGNLYITKTKAGANLSVKLIMKPKK